MDVLDFDHRKLRTAPSIVLASPPCTKFSVASLRWYWGKIEGYDGYVPGKQAREHIKLFKKTMDIIYETGTHFYVVENPMGMAKHVMGDKDHRTYFCIWNDTDPETGKKPAKKPTDLWYHLPSEIEWPPLVKDTWELAPRGSHTGTQGIKDKAVRALIPYALSDFIRYTIDEHYKFGGPAMALPSRKSFNDFAWAPLPEGKK
jgi:hypothetical protein